jgi:LPPG:FO 2-phospho-L-lactate transferase
MKIAALAGGVGGAKLAQGLARCHPAEKLTIIVNTGDDFEHFGLKICPDLDTVCYTLAGMENPSTGWGLRDETWNALQAVTSIGGPDWFGIGDKDLGTHLERTRRLRAGETLSGITREFCNFWSVEPLVIPMSDDAVPTVVITESNELDFQDYFVRQKCEPQVKGFKFSGSHRSKPAPGVLENIDGADIVIVCPSNPWVSIDPILALPGVRSALGGKPVIAISPIIGGKAVKGPAAKMFSELGIKASPLAVAEHYGSRQGGGLLSGFVMDDVDAALKAKIENLGLLVLVTDTLMRGSEDRIRLARQVIAFGETTIRREVS